MIFHIIKMLAGWKSAFTLLENVNWLALDRSISSLASDSFFIAITFGPVELRAFTRCATKFILLFSRIAPFILFSFLFFTFFLRLI